MQRFGAAYCRVLGPARITVDGADAPPELLWRKHLALLIYLARSPRRSRTREHLVGLFWSDRDEKQARHSLSEALRVLRRVLGDQQVHGDVDQIRLGADAIVLDCDRFAALAADGDWAGAAALVEGEFLEGLSLPEANDFENWLGAERATWRAQSLEALVKHAEALLAGADAPAAARAALRARTIDPASEPAARTAMRALALAGDRAAALRVADEVARALREQFGAAPAPETSRLLERIRDARVGHRVLTTPHGARPRPPLLGRKAELAALAAAWERAKGGRGQVVLIEGEPGEGKTRLIDELTTRARLEDVTVAPARAVPADQDRPWSALAGLLTAGLGEAPGLTGAPSGALAALGAIVPDLGARFRTSGPALGAPEALSAGVLVAAQERPLLLALDDAQWIDGSTLAALPGLARDTARHPVLLLFGLGRGSPASGRLDDLRTRLGRELEGEVIRVGRFDRDALRALVAWALPSYVGEDAARLVRRIERDTAGIPLLAVAMLEAVASGAKLAPEAPAWPSPKRTLVDSLPSDLPPAVIGMVCQRFRQITPAAQQVLGAAAALAERAGVADLTRATRLDPAAVEQALDVLEWERWLVADPRGYVLAAPIVRHILLQEMVTPGQARRYRDNLVT
ncbi:MAG TPA: AAA family ATPase [Gemmatimonadales bacterium]|nr:AAA family ATPase [Gemmatimonadales bacterium]